VGVEVGLGLPDGLHVLADVFFLFFSSFLALYYWTIFLFLHISMASPRLTFYHLKGKKRSVALSP
jgi:hypothetical protein